MLTLKKLIVHAFRPMTEESSQSYSFDCFEFQNGLILVPGETTHDWFFENRDQIEACGMDVVASVEETDETIEWTVEDLKKSIDGSISEFGEDSVPQCAFDLVVSEPASLKGYAIGDSSEPGDYHRVGGTWLCNEGAFDCETIEDFKKTVEDLCDNCGWECDFALVATDVNGEESIIEWA